MAESSRAQASWAFARIPSNSHPGASAFRFFRALSALTLDSPTFSSSFSPSLVLKRKVALIDLPLASAPPEASSAG